MSMANRSRFKRNILLRAIAVALLLGYSWVVVDVRNAVHSSVNRSMAAAVAREKIEENLLDRGFRPKYVKNIGIDRIEVCIDDRDTADGLAIKRILDSIEYTLNSEGVEIQIDLRYDTGATPGQGDQGDQED